MADEAKSVVIPRYATVGTVKYTDGDPTLSQAGALFAGLPIVLELGVLVLLLETKSSFFAGCEIIAVSFGVVFVGISLLFLLAHFTFSSGPEKFRRFVRTSRLAMLLLVLNVPVTTGAIWVAIRYV